MPVQRYFLGWDAPVTAKVRAFLMPQRVSGPVDLGKDLIVVPTHQAGRRLMETLALFCADADTALLSARVAYIALWIGFLCKPQSRPFSEGCGFLFMAL